MHLPARSAFASNRVVVEVGQDVERWVEREVVRRLVQLELSDVEVPSPHNAITSDPYSGLYVRVVRDEETLVVQLWDRGELQGQRRLSLRGGQQLRARRIALVSAELARRLADRRVLIAAKARRASLRSKRRQRERALERRQGQATLGSELRATSVGLNDAVLWGSALAGKYTFKNPLQIALSLSASTGYAPPLKSFLQWFEVGLRPAYSWALSPRTQINAGPDVAAAWLRFSEASSVDGIAGRSETWSARAGVFVHWEKRVLPSTSVYLGPEIGLLLRPIQAAHATTGARKLGELWLGLGVGIDVSGI